MSPPLDESYLASIPELFLRTLHSQPHESALFTKQDGTFRGETWSELASEIARAVTALRSLGLRAGEAVAHLSENRREWIVFDLACHFGRFIHVPIHESLGPAQIALQIEHSGAKCLVASRDASWERTERVLERSITGYVYEESGRSDLSWHAALAAAEPSELTCDSITGETIATILYTSGTTSRPRGVVLSQRNLAGNAQAVVAAYGSAERERRLNVLPLSHVYARTCDLYAWLVRGSQLALAESRATFLADAQAFRPTVINAVPYVYARIVRGLREAGVAETPGILRRTLGGEIRSCSCGGAHLDELVYDYFHAQGVPLLSGFGLTETSPVLTVSTREAHRRGSCGRAIPGVELRIDPSGEVLTRGPFVMQGYHADEPATQEAMCDDWFRTGDLGSLDAEGFLFLTGRKKELLVLATGKKISPARIEAALARSEYIEQSLVVGEGRNFPAALIVPAAERLSAACRNRGVSPEQLLREECARLLVEFAHEEQIGKIAILPRAFSAEHEEVTPKLSLRRDTILKNFAAEIETLYRT